MLINDLLDSFNRSYVEKRLKRNIINGYQVNINNHLKPFFENVDIDNLSYDLLDDFCDFMRNQKHLSSRTLTYCLAVLRKSLNFGIRRGYLKVNLFDTYDMPRNDRYIYHTLKPNECKVLLNYLIEHNCDVLLAVFFALRHGMRRGECLAIKNSDIIDGTIVIHNSVVCYGKDIIVGTPKTNSSNRTLLLDDIDFQYLDFYNCSRKPNKNDYLCRRMNGDFLTDNVLQHQFKAVLKATLLPNIRFHDLRHSYATNMLTEQVNPKIVSAILGHSDIKTTLSIYSHEDISMQRVSNEATLSFVPTLKTL